MFFVSAVFGQNAGDLRIASTGGGHIYGKTVPYATIAKTIGSPKAMRAVGSACGRNPIPIIIPCHRVTATNGIGGFSSGLRLKRLLLGVEDHFCV